MIETEAPHPRRIKRIDRYSGDDAETLAREIEAALAEYGRGGDRRLLSVIEFFEGELRLIAKALHVYAVQSRPQQRRARR